MAANTRLVDQIKTFYAAPILNYTGAAMTAAWVSLKNYNHITFTILTGAWAGGTAAVTLNQATAVAGTSTKALGFSKMWTNIASVTGDTYVETAVASNTFNLNTANCTYIIEVDAATLDVTNNFDCITLTIASPGSNNDFYNAIYQLSGARYQQASMPTCLTD
jgi:hypothetical protein